MSALLLTDRLSAIRLLQQFLYLAELCSYIIRYSLGCLQTRLLCNVMGQLEI